MQDCVVKAGALVQTERYVAYATYGCWDRYKLKAIPKIKNKPQGE
jgi:hypothetical protein